MKRKNKLYSRRKFLKQTCGAAIGLGICTWNDWLSINSATTMNSGEAGVNYDKKLSSGTGFIFDKEYLRHKLSEDHPESPQRLRSVWQRMQAIGLDKEVKNISVSGNPLSAIMAIHSESHVNLVEKEATVLRFVARQSQGH